MRYVAVIAASFEAFVQLMLPAPIGCLKFSAGGDIDEMRRAARGVEAMLDQETAIKDSPQSASRRARTA